MLWVRNVASAEIDTKQNLGVTCAGAADSDRPFYLC